MGRSAEAPPPDPANPTGSAEGTRRTYPQHSDTAGAEFTTDELTWREVADAVWLTVTRDEWARDPTPPQISDYDQPRTRHEPSPEPSPPKQQVRPSEPLDHSTDDVTTPQALAPGGADSRRVDRGYRPHPTAPDTRATDRAYDVRSVTSISSGALDFVRALRPLKRKVPSRRDDDAVLDEDATAEQAAHDELWLPVTKPATQRWLDLTLVVDTSPSMTLWQTQVNECISLFSQLGAFRATQVRLLDTGPPVNGSPRTPVLRGGTSATPIRSPTELVDPSGRRIILVLTDGMGQCWQQDLVSPLLAQWGRAMPTTVVNFLRQDVWERSGLALHRARLTVPTPMQPNRCWELELLDAWAGQDPDPADTAPEKIAPVPVPVLELAPRWMGWWARLVTGGHRVPATGPVLLAHSQPRSKWSDGRALNSTYDSPSDTSQQVQQFLSVASPTARRLATLLATVPMSLPVARRVQAELVPESGPAHLAEVFCSGLLTPAEGTSSGGHARRETMIDFPDRVRALLASGAHRSETARVVRLVAEQTPDGPWGHLPAVLADPDHTHMPEHTADAASYVEPTIMRALSGPYLPRAERLRHSTEQEETPMSLGTRAEEISTATLSNVTHRANLVDAATGLSALPESTDSDVDAADEESAARAGSGVTDAPYSSPTPGLKAASQERKTDEPPPVWGNVPLRNPNFTGREELLDQLNRQLAPGGATAVLPAALHGMGGIGKTQMAVEYIYRHLADYDIIWWVQATQPAQIRAGLTELAQRLQLPGSAEANTAIPTVREALRIGEPSRKWLLVFDSAENPDVVRQFFPASEFGTILITSRNPNWANLARPLEIAVFQREESKELLNKRGQEIDGDDADRLAEKLGDLPLAIEQAAAWLAETGMPVHEYLRLFDEKLAEILSTSAPAGYEASVAAAWNVSFDELSTRNSAAHQLLQVCAFFAPDPIPRDLFTGVRGVTILPELDAALRDPMQLGKTIRDIRRYGLAKIDHRNNTLQLHRLVQLVLRNRMTPQRRVTMHRGAHFLLANLDPNDPQPANQWPRYQSLLPHAYAADVIDSDDGWVRQLIINLMIFLYHWGDHEEACQLAQQAVETWTEKLGAKDPQTLRAAERLGFFLWTLGRYAEATERNQKTVEEHRAVSAESEETLIAEVAVATDLKGNGDFLAALELNEQIYQKAKALFGDDDVTTLFAAHDTVVSLGLAGQYRRGSSLAEDTLRRRVENLGPDNPDTISTHNAWILARREAGDYTWARQEQEVVAQRSGVLFGQDRAATLRRRHHLSVARRKSGEHAGALELSSAVLSLFRRRYGNDHPNVMACALANSIDLRHAEQLPAARQLGEETFERYRQVLGEHHPHTLSARLDLAVTLRLLGDTAEAHDLDKEVLRQFREGLGADHPHAIVSAINLASDLAALGDAKAALDLDIDAMERAQRVLGADHPTTLAVAMNHVLDLRSLGRAQEAETQYVDVLTRYRRVLGAEHPGTKKAQDGIRADCDIDPLPL